MRLAVLSDIHGNLRALEAVLADVARRGVDAIVNLGDSLSGPLEPLETAQFLMAQPWPQLAGNHERQLLDFSPEKRGLSDRYAHSVLPGEVFDWMRTLSSSMAFDSEVWLCHGTPGSDVEYFLESIEGTRVRPAAPVEIEQRLGTTASALVLCGHTHVPRVLRSHRGQLLVNPGSVGLPAYDDELPSYHVIENGSPDARYAIVERLPSGWSAALIAVPYDHEYSARLARERGRADWEHALRTGYLPTR
jgi:predicted phosphodiesterase